ncbi:hypothetical protein EYF80_060644 [Liparis tanakae]|uniref:Uncharacterized protein n=1 Tax=Liparis tanakae TaxID=230148 RepID=A0A4Z2EJV0_9TELE|nr:hypothetical protein EYF80_060644 [Liparis tanakae]
MKMNRQLHSAGRGGYGLLTPLSSWISSVYFSCSSLGPPSGRPHSKVTQETPARTRRGASGRAGSVPMV